MTAPEVLNEFKSYVNEYDENMVTMQTVNDCIVIQDYMNDMHSCARQSRLTFEQLVKFVARNLSNPIYKDLDIKIITCFNQIVAIHDLNQAVNSAEEAKKVQILGIMKQSEYHFTVDLLQCKSNVCLSYKKNTKVFEFTVQTLDELKGRALLI